MKQPKPPKLGKLEVNNPFRAAVQDGHMLNESYKYPVPNESGENLSYMHPHGGKTQRPMKTPLPQSRDKKNTF